MDGSLIGIAETGPYDTRYCPTLCKGLQAENCKLLLLCPEEDKGCIAAALEAKRKGIVKDFLFYDASIDFLGSKLLER